jgi:hypothetical protein
VFGFRPESCSPSARNCVRDQPGTLFGFTPESRSPSPGIRTIDAQLRRGAPADMVIMSRGGLAELMATVIKGGEESLALFSG